MLVNPNVDVYTTTPNSHKTLRKTQKITSWKPEDN